MRWIKRGLLVLLAAGIIAAIVVASLPKPVEVDTVEVMRGTLRVTVDADGRTRVQDRYVITSPLYGNLARIELEAGDDLEEGEVVARVTPLEPPLLDTRSQAELEARVKRAAAARRQAEAGTARAAAAAGYTERDLERVRILANKGTLSAQALEQAELEARRAEKTLESAEFGARVARYELEMAKAALGRLEDGDDGGTEALQIAAPVDGRVLKIFRESEGVANPGEALLEIGDPGALEIVVDILTSDAVEVESGDEVEITRWGGEQPLHGVVRLVEPSAFTKISALGVEEQRVNVIIDITEPSDIWRGLGDGYRVEVAVEVWEGDEVIKVPAGALHRRDEQWGVFVVEDAVAHERTVEIGRRSGFEVEVLSGLEPGETIVVHPSDRVTDGADVQPRR